MVKRALHRYSWGLATDAPDAALSINCAVSKATRIQSRNCVTIGAFNLPVNARH